MASIIRIKRSSVSGNPTTLGAGELAYSALTDNGSNGGDRLYIGMGTETAGNAANHIVIGGKYFTDLVSAATNLNTASAIVKRDASGNFSAGTITAALSGNASTATKLATARAITLDGDISGTVNFDGSADVTITTTIQANSIVLGTDTSGNYVATVGGSSDITVSGSGSETAAVSLALADTTVTAGSYGSATSIPTFTVDTKGRLTAAGSASISTTLNIAGGTGTGSVALGSQSLTIAGGTGITTSASGQTVTITNSGVTSLTGTTNQVIVSAGTGAVTLSLPQNIHSGATPSFAGLSLSGNIAMGTNSITGLADPVNPQDAATKAYVDAARSGLDVKASVRAATTGNITLSGAQTIDGVALSVGDRVLVKDQGTASENGIYVVASGSWTRASDADNNPGSEVSSGMFTFVEEGTTNSDSGWVLTTNDPIVLGTSLLTFAQFSGTGQIVAGNGLTKTGNTLDVQVGTGIAIVSDTVTLASSVAGAGLTFTSGVLDVVGTADRITINTDSIDIASTYVGQTSITTLGTIGTGTWNGTTIGTGYGGTGLTTYAAGDLIYASATNTLAKRAAGTDGQVLQMNSSGLPVWGDIDGGTY